MEVVDDSTLSIEPGTYQFTGVLDFLARGAVDLAAMTDLFTDAVDDYTGIDGLGRVTIDCVKTYVKKTLINWVFGDFSGVASGLFEFSAAPFTTHQHQLTTTEFVKGRNVGMFDILYKVGTYTINSNGGDLINLDDHGEEPAYAYHEFSVTRLGRYKLILFTHCTDGLLDRTNFSAPYAPPGSLTNVSIADGPRMYPDNTGVSGDVFGTATHYIIDVTDTSNSIRVETSWSTVAANTCRLYVFLCPFDAD